MAEELNIDFDRFGEIYVGTLRGPDKLDAFTCDRFGELLAAHLAEHAATPLLLNFSHINYLSSAALRELIRARTALQEVGSTLRCCGLGPDTRLVFEITNLDKEFACDEEWQIRVREAADRFNAALEA